MKEIDKALNKMKRKTENDYRKIVSRRKEIRKKIFEIERRKN